MNFQGVYYAYQQHFFPFFSIRCFIPNAYAALFTAALVPLMCLVVVFVVFIHAYQVTPQWKAYDDIFRGRTNAAGMICWLPLCKQVVLLNGMGCTHQFREPTWNHGSVDTYALSLRLSLLVSLWSLWKYFDDQSYADAQLSEGDKSVWNLEQEISITGFVTKFSLAKENRNETKRCSAWGTVSPC